MRKFAPLFPGGRGGKHALLAVAVWLLLGAGGAPAAPRPIGGGPHRVVIPAAARLEIAHTGIHTHANFLLFATGRWDVAAMRRDPTHFPHLSVRGRSDLPTDRAALPPGLAEPGDPPLPNPYGPIEGDAAGRRGWDVIAQKINAGKINGGKISGENGARVLVPTGFANWLALQPTARRRLYADRRRWRLEIRWGTYPSTKNLPPAQHWLPGGQAPDTK